MNEASEVTARRAEVVAIAVWRWLQEQRRVKYMPWVLDPDGDEFDSIMHAKKEMKDYLLIDLGGVIDDACRRAKSIKVKGAK